MALVKFEVKEKFGLKNNSNVVIVEPIYDEMHLTNKGAVASRRIYDESEEEDKLEIYSIDSSGDIVVNIIEELDKQGVDNVLEYWQGNDNLFLFQYSNYDTMELMGVFNQYGQVIIKPEYDEIELISENLMLCFHGAHYDEYDSLGVKNYGNKLFNINGKQIEEESIKDYEELDDGEILFIINSGSKFTTDKYGDVIK